MTPVPYHAAAAAARFLSDHGDSYCTFIIRGFDSKEKLIYGFRTESAAWFLRTVEDACSRGHRAYAQIARLPGADHRVFRVLSAERAEGQ